MTSINQVTFDPCDELKCIQVDVCVENEGHLLVVPVYLRNICPCRNIVVCVSVYVDGKFYAMKTKKLFTGHHHHKIKSFYAGDFLFLFTAKREKHIRTKVLSHYIY